MTREWCTAPLPPEVSYSHKWMEGDVVVLDNLAAVGRCSFTPRSPQLDPGLTALDFSI